MVLEVWRNGIRERRIQRLFFYETQKGRQVNPKGDVTITVLTDKDQRSIVGWDPDNPLPLPLDIAKQAGDFSKVRAVISPRIPTKVNASAFYDLNLPLLPVLAKSSEIVAAPPLSAGKLCFEIKKSNIGFYSGAKLEIDPAHGYSSCRFAFKDGVHEVEDYSESDDHIWVPKRVRRSTSDGVMLVHATACRVNGPIADSDLDFPFPEGARVDDPQKKAIYIWGKTGPAKTFANDKDLSSYLESRLAEEESAPAPTPIRWSGYLLWGNLALILVIAALVVYRRRLARQTKP
jgi:hypothetical protein